MTQGEPAWRGFLRALADEIDSAGIEARDAMLQAAGRRMAKANPLLTPPDIAALELEINDHLAGWGWGHARLRLIAEQRVLMITHVGLPHVGGAGNPPGTWLSAVLEGLYECWLAALPGADGALVARRFRVAGDSIELRYGQP